MAYSRSETTLKKMLPDLQEIALGRPQAWIITQGSAQEWAYKVREALFIARLHKSRYPELAAAAESFTVEVVDSQRVQARRARQTTEAVALADDQNPTHGLETFGRSVQSSGQQSPFTIIEAWRKSQPSNQPIHFPEATLSEDQLTILYKWAQAWKPPLMLMVDGNSVTVGPTDKQVMQYAWRPPEERGIVAPPAPPKPPKREAGEP